MRARRRYPLGRMAATGAGFCVIASTSAQIVTDGTLGAASTLSGINVTIAASLGQQAGANLFHSFSAFNVATGGSAIFSGPVSVGNVIARVTGSTASSINGRLGTSITGANLYLINPRGIVFGANATLDLTGSFHATTANSVRMSDGTRFDAVAVTPSVLSVAAPQSFGFLGPTNAPISVNGAALAGAIGKDVTLAGGDITVSGSTARLRARGGDLRVASVGGAGELALDSTLQPGAGTAMGTVLISSGAQLIAESVTTPALAPGRIIIRGGQVAIAGATVSSTNTRTTDAAPIEITATGTGFISRGGLIISRANGAGRGADIQISGTAVQFDQFARTQTVAASTGRGGDVRVTADTQLNIVAVEADPNYTSLYSFALAAGRGGNISLVGDTVNIDAAIVGTDNRATGAAGNISILAREATLQRGAYVYSYSTPASSGAGGSIEMQASSRITVADADWTGYQSTVSLDSRGAGAAGSLRVNAPQITIAGAEISAITTSAARGGDVTLNADRYVHSANVAASNVFTYSYGAGRAGNIAVNAREITIAGGGGITSVAYSTGSAGSIRLTGDVIRVADGGSSDVNIESGTSNFTTGDGGNVEIRASTSFTIDTTGNRSSFARIAATTQGNGRGGSILIDAPSVVLDGGALFSRTRFGTGDQGAITVRADTLDMRHDGRIVSSTEGDRNGSLIDIAARTIEMRDASYIQAVTFGSGNAGRVRIGAERIRMTGASRIEVSSYHSGGNAGDLSIDLTGSFEMVERIPWRGFNYAGSDPVWPGGLTSQAFGSGNAGSISLRAPSITLHDGRILSSAVQNGRGGSVAIGGGSMTMLNGSQIDARSSGGSTGAAGSIDIQLSGDLRIVGRSPTDGAFSGLFAETQGSGRGGNITVGASTLTIDRGLIRTSTTGLGNAGTMTLRATDLAVVNGGWIDAGTGAGSQGAGGVVDIKATRSISISGSDSTASAADAFTTDLLYGAPVRTVGPFASTISSNTAGAGAGGNLALNAPRISVSDGGRVSASATASGNAGSISLVAANSLQLIGGTIVTEALASDGGNIDIRVGDLIRASRSEISTAVGSGSGAGGNIFIDPIFVILDQGTRIIANAAGGPGGNILIVANYFFNAPGTLIDASSALGLPGTVQINTSGIDLVSALAALPAQFLDATSLLRTACSVRGSSGGSSLRATGRSGLPFSPEQNLFSSYFDQVDSSGAGAGAGVVTGAGTAAAAGAPASPLLAWATPVFHVACR